jgi:hypothetical protein
VRIVDEISLRIHCRIFGDDLNAVLIRPDRAIGAKTVKKRAHDIVPLDRKTGINREAGV